jgi:hypothetical protein
VLAGDAAPKLKARGFWMHGLRSCEAGRARLQDALIETIPERGTGAPPRAYLALREPRLEGVGEARPADRRDVRRTVDNVPSSSMRLRSARARDAALMVPTRQSQTAAASS